MAVHAQPIRSASDLEEVFHDIDRATERERQRVPRAVVETNAPPVYGGPQRDAINSVVDNIVGDICGKISSLRKTLDAIEAQVLASAAKSKHSLNEHVLVCIRINDEIVHMQEVIADLAADTREA